MVVPQWWFSCSDVFTYSPSKTSMKVKILQSLFSLWQKQITLYSHPSSLLLLDLLSYPVALATSPLSADSPPSLRTQNYGVFLLIGNFFDYSDYPWFPHLSARLLPLSDLFHCLFNQPLSAQPWCFLHLGDVPHKYLQRHVTLVTAFAELCAKVHINTSYS